MLTKENIEKIPELLKTKTRQQIATEFKVSKTAIDYWCRKFEQKGVLVNKWNRSKIEQINIEEPAV